LASAQAVARLIGSLQFSSVSDDPPTRTRFLRITLTEAAPSTALGVATITLTVNAVNDPPVFVIPQVGVTPVFKAVAGVALRIRVLADDVDLPVTATLSYSLVSITPPSAGVATVNLTSGSLTFTPLATFSGTADLVVRATDNLGGSTPDTLVQVNVLAGPTNQGPLVVSDPPFESFEAQALSYPMVIRPDPSLGVIPASSVTVDLVGDLPPGAHMDVGFDQTHPVLAAPPLERPSDGVYTFGLRVEVDYGGTIGKKVGYQPVTFKIRATGAAN
jgi:hypothetical protein